MTSDQPAIPHAEDLMSSAMKEAPVVEENIEPEETEAVMVEDPTKPKEETDEPVEPAKSTSEQLIYIGDSIRRNGVALRKDQIFIGGLPVYLNELYEEYPMIKTLFVPVSSMFEAKKEMQTIGTSLYMANRSLKGD